MMKGPLLVLALSGLCAPVAAQAPAAPSPVELLRDACVATDMERAPFEALAAEKGWTSRPHVPPADAPNEWGVRYSSGSAHVLLMGADRTVRVGRSTYPAFKSCNVVMVGPAGDWREEMDALALELEFRRYAPDTSASHYRPPAGERDEWRRRNGFIKWSYSPNDRILRLEIYRSLDSSFRFPPR